jgi:prepilin-type N-terminal cleavage/methylation domain-containing protein
MRRRGDFTSMRRGFTLLELVAALALTGLALVGTQQLLVQLADGRDRLHAQSAMQTLEINGGRFLSQLVGNADGSDTTRRFSGSASETSFASWCPGAGGWLEKCPVVLRIEKAADSSIVLASDGRVAALRLTALDGVATFAYFEPGRGWLRAWPRGLTQPAAIGIVSAGDTLVLPMLAGQ